MSVVLRRTWAAVAALLCLAVLPAPASAADARIVYARAVRGGFDVFSAQPDGDRVRRLTRGTDATAPVWSPDRRWVAYAKFIGDQADIVVRRTDGSDARRLTRTGSVAEIPTSWSDDGWIAYDRIIGDDIGISAIRRNGARRHLLQPTSRRSWFGADWSPNGRKLAVARIRNRDFESVVQIVTVNTDGTGVDVLTSRRSVAVEPRWSPDGDLIAYTQDTGGDGCAVSLRVMRAADGGGKRRLADTPCTDRSPAWSPDGSRVAFISEGPGDDARLGIYTVARDGTDLRHVLDANVIALDW